MPCSAPPPLLLVCYLHVGDANLVDKVAKWQFTLKGISHLLYGVGARSHGEAHGEEHIVGGLGGDGVFHDTTTLSVIMYYGSRSSAMYYGSRSSAGPPQGAPPCGPVRALLPLSPTLLTLRLPVRVSIPQFMVFLYRSL